MQKDGSASMENAPDSSEFDQGKLFNPEGLWDQMTPEEIAEEYELLSAAGRRWRAENPDKYDENNPPSKVWQDELYDDQGLPK